MDAVDRKKMLYDDIYEKIKENILCRRYPEDSYLVERRIAEEIVCSRTPIRKAFKRLEAEGWIQYVRNRGMKVKMFTELEVYNIFEVRKPLEGIATYNACKYINWDSLQLLKEHLGKEKIMAQNRDWNSFIDEDLAFHDIILKSQENDIIQKILENLRAKSKVIAIRLLYRNTGRIELTLNEHEKIYYAILRNRPEDAQNLMKQHIQSVYEAACDYLVAVQKDHIFLK